MKTIKHLILAVCIAIFNLAVLSFNSNAQTSIPGGNVSGFWALAGSPYYIQGSIVIPNDSTLTIEPGVTVNFQGTSAQIYIIFFHGCLQK